MRYYYLDFARGLLMSLGVVIHSAQVYSLDDWRVHSHVNSVVFNYLIYFIHSFRMSSFYVISGFFSMMLYQRYPLKDFYKNRLIRLGVPVFFCGIFLNSINYLLSYGNAKKGLSAFNFEYWLGGGWLGHLWFLTNLIVYLVLLAVILRLISQLPVSLKRVRVHPIAIFCCMPLVIFFFLRISWRLPKPPFGDAWFFITANNLLLYAPYFILGVVFYVHHDLFISFIGNVKFAVSGIIMYSLLLTISPSATYFEYFKELSGYLFVICFISLMLFSFKKYFNKNSRFVRSISDSSYTVYLVHPLVLLLIAHLLVDSSLNIYIQFMLLVTSVWMISYLIHVSIISRYKIFNFFFNGKYK